MSHPIVTTEVRLDRLRPDEVAAAIARAPVAWLPLGAVEYHAPHLPLGTDSLTAVEVVARAAREVGGVVLPPVVTTLGTLHLPWSLRFDPTLVEATLRATIDQLAGAGARVVVVHTGHAPLDLLHRIKRVCGEAEHARRAVDDSFRAYGLCYLELNAAGGAGLGTDWPVPVDHGSVLETSLVLAIAPELVDLDALPGPPDTPVVGIYGPDPRGRATAELGEARLAQGTTLLVERVRALLAGGSIDPLADLRLLVERYWPEPMELGLGDPTTLLLRNTGPVSRYLSALRLAIDGRDLDPARVSIRNPTPGEAGVAVPVEELGPDAGFYVRRAQAAEVLLPMPLGPGSHALVLSLGLGGVATTELRTTVDVPPGGDQP
jgi:creatinine amidohydrolase